MPSKEDMRHLVLLLATLYLRVPSFRETLETPMRRTKKIVDSISNDVSISNREKFEYNQTDLIKAELKLIDTVQECLANKYYQLHIIENPEENVVTSDRPFILSHPNGGECTYFGLNTPHIEICVPITRNAIIIARNEPFDEGLYVADRELVGLTNMKLILSASRFFYSSNEDILLVDDDIAVYKHKISTNKALHRTNR